MSESQPTSSSRWMSRSFHALLVSILLILVGIRVYGYFVKSETELAVKGIPHKDQDIHQLRSAGDKAFREEDWESAAEAYGRIAEQDPTNLRVRVRLAYALHNIGQHDPALAEFLFVCQFDGDVRQWALYHIASIYAIKGEKRLALDYLSEAAAEGLRMEEPIVDDPDFKGLLDDSEFQQLAELIKPVLQRDVYHRFDFLVGRWNLMRKNGNRIGSLTVTRSLEGYGLRGECVNESESSKMTFFAYYDPDFGDWRHFWLDQQGSIIQIQGEPSEDNALVLRGHHVSAGAQKKLARAIYTASEGGIVHLELATSVDEGMSWQTFMEATLLPSKLSNTRPTEQLETPGL